MSLIVSYSQSDSIPLPFFFFLLMICSEVWKEVGEVKYLSPLEIKAVQPGSAV